MNADGGRLEHRRRIANGIDRVVARLLAAKAAVERDEMHLAEAELGAAIDETAALAKDLHA